MYQNQGLLLTFIILQMSARVICLVCDGQTGNGALLIYCSSFNNLEERVFGVVCRGDGCDRSSHAVNRTVCHPAGVH